MGKRHTAASVMKKNSQNEKSILSRFPALEINMRKTLIFCEKICVLPSNYQAYTIHYKNERQKSQEHFA
jgi:hypothetical protein